MVLNWDPSSVVMFSAKPNVENIARRIVIYCLAWTSLWEKNTYTHPVNLSASTYHVLVLRVQ